jgi:hypothetical protein
VSGSRDNTIRICDLDLINIYLAEGKDAPEFKNLYEYSFKLLHYKFDGIILVPDPPPPCIPLVSVKDPLERFNRPRPTGVDFVDWILANTSGNGK